jgi:hypothetical protein
MSKGGSQTTEQVQNTDQISVTTIDPKLEQGATAAMAGALKAAGLEYRPNRGVTIAGLTPQHMAAFEGANQAATALGLSTGSTDYLPVPERSAASGLLGYSTGGLYDEMVASSMPAVDQLARRDIQDYFAAEGYDVSGRRNPRNPDDQMIYTDKRTGREITKEQYDRMVNRPTYNNRPNPFADRYEAKPYDWDADRFYSTFTPSDPSRGIAEFQESRPSTDAGGK